MKKCIAIILSVTILGIFSACVSAESEQNKIYKSGDYTYTLVGDKAQIIRYKGNAKNVTVPETIDGHTVFKIGSDICFITGFDDSFDDFNEEDGYTEDSQKSGFAKTKVESVSIPDTVTELASSCFYGCKHLKKIKLSDNLRYISNSLFWNCKSLKSVKIPDSVTEICSYAFAGTALKSLRIPKNVRIINLHSDNARLKKYTVAKGNKNFSAKNGVLYNKKKTRLIIYPRSKPGKSFTIPKGVRQIGIYSFASVKKLERLILPKTLERIKTYAFMDCKLKEVKCKPRGSKRLVFEEQAFEYCNKFKSIKLPKNTVLSKGSVGYYEVPDYGQGADYSSANKISGFTIKGYKNSNAEKYAKKHGFKFVPIG